VKTAEEATVYGGTAGEPYDPCYHQACDDITNLNTKALFELGDGAAHAVMTLARTRTGFFEDGSFRARAGVSAKRLPFRGPKPPPDPPGRPPDPTRPGRPPAPRPGRSDRALPGLPIWPHRFGPTNSSSRATLSRLATDRLQRLFGRHSIPSWSQARPKIPRMSADTLLKW
jgi:hypothetical protein